MGVDLHVADLLDQIIHYGGSPAFTFVFLLDSNTGLSIYHPGGLRDLLITPGAASSRRPPAATAATEEAFQHSTVFQEPLLHVHVRNLERTPGFESLVLSRILSGEINGTVDILVEIVGFVIFYVPYLLSSTLLWFSLLAQRIPNLSHE